MYLCMYVFILPSILLSIYISIYLSIYLFIHPSIYLSIYLSIRVSLYIAKCSPLLPRSGPCSVRHMLDVDVHRCQLRTSVYPAKLYPQVVWWITTECLFICLLDFLPLKMFFSISWKLRCAETLALVLLFPFLMPFKMIVLYWYIHSLEINQIDEQKDQKMDANSQQFRHTVGLHCPPPPPPPTPPPLSLRASMSCVII